MSGSTTTGASGGQSLSALGVAKSILPTDKVTGLFGGDVLNGAVADLVAAGLPDTVVHTDDLNMALSSTALGQYTAQSAASAELAQTGANKSIAASAASGVNSQSAAQSASDAATILAGTQQAQAQIEGVSASAQNALTGVTADANAAKVLLTAAINGQTPLNYRGYWNAATNRPALANGTGAEGDLYVVSVAGSTALDGNASWALNDAAWFTGGKWQYFARAGWAAVAQTLTALQSVAIGDSLIRTPGSSRWSVAWLDALGGIIAGILADGSPQFPGASALIGPSEIATSALSGSGVVTLDQAGGVVDNRSTLVFPGLPEAARGAISKNVTERAPGYLDDSVVGYAPNDIWQAKKQLYTCLRNGAGGAVWDLTPDVAPACPGDVFGTDLVGAWGVDTVVAGFTGPAFDVTTTVGGASVVTTVPIVAGGKHDAGILSRALIQRDSGTTAEVTTLYDQSGAGHNLTGSYGSSPKIGVVTVNGFPAISFDTSGASAARSLKNTAVSLASGTFTALAFGRWAGTNAASDERIQLLTVGSVSTISGINEDGKLGLYDGTSYVQGSQYQPCNPSMVGISAAGGTSVSTWIGETSNAVTVAASALGTMTGFTLGSSGLGNACNGVLTGVVLAKRAATTADIQRANRSATLRWNYTPQVKPRLFCIGDSRTAGYINADCQNWPGMIGDYLDQPLEVFNLAVSGSQTTDFIPNTQPGLITELGKGGYDLATIWLGINDFSHGKDKAATLQNVQSIAAAVLAAGVKHVWIISEAKVGDMDWFWQYFPAGQHPNITLLTPFLGGLPLSVNAAGNYDPLLWHPDTIHPLPPTCRTLASDAGASVNAFIAQDLDA
ncbi:MAG: SGNH/GDSL hydrolase family protein [Gluconobacter cerinus]|uniref:GDSL-type esterase/lipase family protein n=1 Tax=Gluconobacter cerinus TaxID=38307 RepID=UPI0039E76003